MVPGLNNTRLRDARTGKTIRTNSSSGTQDLPGDVPPGTLGIWTICKNKNLIERHFVAHLPIANDAGLVTAWTEVVSRREANPSEGLETSLTAEFWEEWRKRPRRMLPSDASPILKAVAQDKTFFYKKIFRLRQNILASAISMYADDIVKPGAGYQRCREALEKISWAYEINEIGGDHSDVTPNLLNGVA